MLFPSAIQSNILVVDQQRDMIINWGKDTKAEVRKCSDCEFEARTKGGLQTHYLMRGVWIYQYNLAIWTNGLAGKKYSVFRFNTISFYCKMYAYKHWKAKYQTESSWNDELGTKNTANTI